MCLDENRPAKRMNRVIYLPHAPGQDIPLGRAILSEGSLTLGLNSFTVLGAQEHREMTRSPIAENEVGCVAE